MGAPPSPPPPLCERVPPGRDSLVGGDGRTTWSAVGHGVVWRDTAPPAAGPRHAVSVHVNLQVSRRDRRARCPTMLRLRCAEAGPVPATSPRSRRWRAEGKRHIPDASGASTSSAGPVRPVSLRRRVGESTGIRCLLADFWLKSDVVLGEDAQAFSRAAVRPPRSRVGRLRARNGGRSGAAPLPAQAQTLLRQRPEAEQDFNALFGQSARSRRPLGECLADGSPVERAMRSARRALPRATDRAPCEEAVRNRPPRACRSVH